MVFDFYTHPDMQNADKALFYRGLQWFCHGIEMVFDFYTEWGNQRKRMDDGIEIEFQFLYQRNNGFTGFMRIFEKSWYRNQNDLYTKEITIL